MKRVLSNSANFDLILPFCSFQTYIDKYTNTNTIFSYIDLFASLHMAHRTRQNEQPWSSLCQDLHLQERLKKWIINDKSRISHTIHVGLKQHVNALWERDFTVHHLSTIVLVPVWSLYRGHEVVQDIQLTCTPLQVWTNRMVWPNSNLANSTLFQESLLTSTVKVRGFLRLTLLTPDIVDFPIS
jgi:hypothetical protein